MVSLVAAVALIQVDRSVAGVLPSSFSYWVFGGDADAARSILESLASSLITVTSLTFSLTVVTLQLASSQFSPRLLRTFTRDRVVQGTLALFLGTFVFALTVLRTVRSSSDGTDEFVPQISVTVCYLLTIASVVGLVVFLAHLAEEIRVETMLRTVQREGVETLRRTLSDRETTGDNSSEAGVGAVALLASDSGFISSVQSADLCTAAVEHDVVIMLTAATGSSVVENTPIGQVWPRRPGRTLDQRERETIQRCSARAVGISFERTSVEDVGFGLRQITDIAAKALSPGVNDPTTATHAIGGSSALLCALARLPLGDELIRSEDRRLRVVIRRPTFAGLVRLAVEQPRRYGASEPQVAERLFQLLHEVAWVARGTAQQQVLREEVGRLWAAVNTDELDDGQRRRYERLRDQVELDLTGDMSEGDEEANSTSN